MKEPARFNRWSVCVLCLFALQSFAEPTDPFDPVWNTMTQVEGGDSPGCRGCHIAPEPGFGPWFGDTRDDVLAYFISGPGASLVAGCRQSLLAASLGLVDGQPPFMPRDAPFDGRFWVDDPNLGLTELTDLGIWLDSLCSGGIAP